MPLITSLRPGQRPPQVTMAARLQAGSWKILAWGPVFSKEGAAPRSCILQM